MIGKIVRVTVDRPLDSCHPEYPDLRYSVNYGILNPANPSGVCNEIYEKTGVMCMIVDASDLSRELLGKADCLTMSEEELCDIIRDNPAGQSAQRTPFILIRKKA